MVGDRLQEGIYWQSGATPPDHLRLLFLNFPKSTSVSEAHRSLSKIWTLYESLKVGKISDLKMERPDEPDFSVPHGNLRAMIGFGVRLFDRRSHPAEEWVAFDQRPEALGGRLRGGAARPFDALHWDKDSKPTIAQTDVMIQLTSETELAANRFIVEILKLIEDESLGVEMTTFASGFHRDDRRSWIDFHDGVNNMRASERAVAMEVSSLDFPWMIGGTYVAFLKIAADLTEWRKLDRTQQEVIIGRTKLTGCPLLNTEHSDDGVSYNTIDDCPNKGNLEPPLSLQFRDPPRPVDDLVRASHIHRSNQNRGAPDQDSNNRIYRQGYEFLDPADGGVKAGLNFIGFQRDLISVRNILNIRSWMGGVNFGGPEETTGTVPPVQLMSLLAGGFFAIPPNAEPYPGAELFTSQLLMA